MRLVGQVLLLLVAQLARAVGDRAALGGRPCARVIDVPIAYSWIIAREISATRCRSLAAPVVTAPKTISSATRPPSSTVMLVDQLLARLEVAVLVGQVERVAERAAARDDRDLVHAVDAGQQLGAQRVAGLVEGDDAALVLVERAARLHAGDDALERVVEVGLRERVAAARGAAKIAASLQMLARSAPVRPRVWRATTSRSTSSPSGLLRVCTRRIASRPSTSGGETKTWRSKRPGRSSAGSSFSSRFEAAITTRSPVEREAVHLDQQLVERLLALGVVVRAARARRRRRARR